MANTAPKEFTVDVEDVGTFRFAHRTMSHEMRIQREVSRMLDGCEPVRWFFNVVTWMAPIRVLMIEGPEDFDIDAMDPLDDTTWPKLEAVFFALRDEEERFRGRPPISKQAVRQGVIEDGGLLGETEVPADAE